MVQFMEAAKRAIATILLAIRLAINPTFLSIR